jgi:amidohydrolase
MLRAEMDGLPVREQTHLPYASTSFQNDEFGVLRPTMHACGHDMHVAALMAASTLLNSAKHLWNGTVIALFQPNEERTGGAQAMVDDGLYTKVPRPDVLLGQHIEPFKAGEVRIRSGDLLVHADSIDIRVFGAPGPKMNPQDCANPTVMACKMVVRFDKIVAEEVSSDDYALLSVWDFKAGIKEDDAWGWVDMNVDLQTYRKEVRERVIASIRRIVEEESKSAGATKAPIIKTRVRAHTTRNSPEIVDPVRRIFEEVFHVEGMEREENAEDFGVLARPFKTPYAYWSVGATDHATWEDAKQKNDITNLIPVNHSPFFAPAIQPTLRVATDALALAALTFLEVDTENICHL